MTAVHNKCPYANYYLQHIVFVRIKATAYIVLLCMYFMFKKIKQFIEGMESTKIKIFSNFAKKCAKHSYFLVN